jgi:predicted outer membrane protein
MSKLFRTFAATVAALPLLAGAMVYAQTGAQQATQTKEERQQGQANQNQSQSNQAAQPQAGQSTTAQPQPGQNQATGTQPRPGGQFNRAAPSTQAGQVVQGQQPGQAAHPGANDQLLVKSFLIAPNQEEVALGQLAQQRAQNEEVKQFAERMVREHGETLQKLQTLSGATSQRVQAGNTAEGAARATTPSSVTQPSGPQAGQAQGSRPGTPATAHAGQDGILASALQEIHRNCQQMTMQELQKHQGSDFDQAYMGIMVMGHGQMLATLKGIRNQASPELQQILSQSEDTAHQHHELAQQILKNLGKEGDATRAATRPTAQPKQ